MPEFPIVIPKTVLGGPYVERAVEMAHAIRRIAGVSNAPIRRLPWIAVHLMGLVNET